VFAELSRIEGVGRRFETEIQRRGAVTHVVGLPCLDREHLPAFPAVDVPGEFPRVIAVLQFPLTEGVPVERDHHPSSSRLLLDLSAARGRSSDRPVRPATGKATTGTAILS
jgi:hypothetical protein